MLDLIILAYNWTAGYANSAWRHNFQYLLGSIENLALMQFFTASPVTILKTFKRNLQTSHLVTIDQQIPRYENIWNKLYRDSRVGTSFWFSEEWTLDSVRL